MTGRRRAGLPAWIAICALSACDTTPVAMPDAAPDSGPRVDMAQADMAVDAEPGDAEPGDAEPSDAEPSDAGPADARPADAAVMPDAGEADMGALPPCVDHRVEPGQAFARAFDLVTFRALNTSDARRFEFVTNASGAILNDETGAYLAGEVTGVRDVIRVVDPTCTGEVRAQVQVVEEMAVAPTNISVEALGRFTFEIIGGSGQVTYSIVQNETGAAVDPRSGLYVAGNRLGQDLVRVTDSGTGQLVEVFVTVVEDIVMRADPPQLFLPVGASHPLEIIGGSGEVEIEGLTPGVAFEGGVLRALAPGKVTVTLRDRFLDLSTRMEITALDSLQPTLSRGGDGSSWTVFHAPGDLNGDGFADAIAGYSEADIGSVDAGAVYVYHGSAEGLGPAPVQVLHGERRRDFFGRDLATGDIDGDGQTDLLIGAHLANIGAGDTGAIYVHRGLADGTFTADPWRVIPGRQNGDQAGRGIAVCDVNGDERLDLIVGSWLGEDRSLGADGSNQGTVSIHLGYEEGLLERPDQVIYGVWPDEEGTLAPQANQRLGMVVDAGDMDGDGLCEVVASTTQLGGDGMVFIYKGRAPDGIDNGGVTQLPVKIIFRADDERTGNQLGRRMAMGDVDGDGLADLLLGRHVDDDPPNNAGSAWLFRGGPLDPDPATELTPVTEADWHARGNQANDQFGIGVDVGDYTGDGIDDIIVGAWFDELPGEPTTGVLHVFNGVEGGLPGQVADRLLAPADPAASANILLGEDMTVLGDVDGDGDNDLIATAAREDTLGEDVGRWYVFPNDADPYPVDLPGSIGGNRFGMGVAIVPDLDGDGLPEAMAGAPYQGFANQGHGGTAWIFPGTADGFAVDPAATVRGWPNHTGYDRVGYNVRGVGDFDGDGLQDWAVAARDDETVNPNADFAHQGDCITNSGTGTIYIFRGQRNGIAERPSWAVQGRRGNALLYAIGHADVDGDGRSDLIGGAPFADQGGSDRGEVIVVKGRAPGPDNKIQVLCDPVLRFVGEHNSANLGRTVTGMGDLDGDGCEEFAFGAPRSDIDGRNNQGAVRVVYGWGGAGCPAAPEAVVMNAAETSADVGWSIAAARLDNDDVPDLVVGAPNHLVDGARRGGAWVVPGSYINSLARRPLEETRANADTFDPRGAVWVIEGRTSGERFGTSVGAVRGLIAVGSPLGSYSGVPLVGGARVFRVNNNGVQPAPVAAFIGQTWRPEGRLGEELHFAGPAARPALIVGGYDANGPRIEGEEMADPGGAYSFILSRLGR